MSPHKTVLGRGLRLSTSPARSTVCFLHFQSPLIPYLSRWSLASDARSRKTNQSKTETRGVSESALTDGLSAEGPRTHRRGEGGPAIRPSPGDPDPQLGEGLDGQGGCVLLMNIVKQGRNPPRTPQAHISPSGGQGDRPAL